MKQSIKKERHGHKYPRVEELPPGAQLVSAYASIAGYKHAASVYVQYERAKAGTGSPVSYKIVNYQGMNFIVKED